MATVKSLEAALHLVVDALQINDAHKQELHDAIGTTNDTEGAEDDGRERD